MAYISGTNSYSLVQLRISDTDKESEIKKAIKEYRGGSKCIMTLTRPDYDKKVDKILKKLHFRKVCAFKRNHDPGLLTMRILEKGKWEIWE